MSLGKIAPVSRNTLRLHGWFLVAWIAAIGLTSSLLLLHGFHIHSMAVRYSLGAAAVYFLGFVVGGWWYANWWNDRKATTVREMPVHASTEEQREYEQEQERIRKKVDGFSWIGDFGVGGDDVISVFLGIVFLLVFFLLALLLAGYLPMLLTDMMAGYLAEIVLEFVIGAVIYRRVLKPQPVDGYWTFALRKTMLAGVFMVVLFGVFGYGLQQINPQAQTFVQVFR